MSFISKLYSYRWVFRSLPKTLWFNFHYLPFSQAVRLPIFLYRPRLVRCRGKIRIEGPVRTGMIHLGAPTVSLYPNDGIMYENHGGTVVFSGHCMLGNHSFLSIGESGEVYFGDTFRATAVKIACYNRIRIEPNVRIGWECVLTDTDFHALTVENEDGTLSRSAGSMPVRIGHDSWIAMRCMIFKGTVLPPRTVVAAGSLLNRAYDVPEKTLLGGQPARCLRHGVYRNLADDRIVS